jgi:hypothetical protein
MNCRAAGNSRHHKMPFFLMVCFLLQFNREEKKPQGISCLTLAAVTSRPTH